MHLCIFDRIAGDWVWRDYEDIRLSHNLCRILCSINFMDFHLSSPLHSIFATVTWHSDRLQEKGSRHEEEDSFRKEVDRMMERYLTSNSLFPRGADPQGGDEQARNAII